MTAPSSMCLRARLRIALMSDTKSRPLLSADLEPFFFGIVAPWVGLRDRALYGPRPGAGKCSFDPRSTAREAASAGSGRAVRTTLAVVLALGALLRLAHIDFGLDR